MITSDYMAYRIARDRMQDSQRNLENAQLARTQQSSKQNRKDWQTWLALIPSVLLGLFGRGRGV